MDIVFATKNPAKLKEVQEIMEGSDIRVISLTEAGFDDDITEDGSTFAENAAIKAMAVMTATGKLTLADDSGLEIDYLDNAPGVYSARFMGEDTSYAVKNRRILDMLEGVPESRRGARFVCAIAAAFPEGFAERVVVEEACVQGLVARDILGDNGFGYDPIFFVPELGMTTAQMTPQDKHRISHRGKALRQMKERLANIIPREGGRL